MADSKRVLLGRSTSSIMVAADDSVLVLNGDLEWEVLVRLPRKSLMRFKCVSKQWNSIILDPFFAKACVAGFHGLILSHVPHVDSQEIWSGQNNRFFELSYVIDHNFKKNNYTIQGGYLLLLGENYFNYCHHKVTNIEKGVFGIYNEVEFKLCNIATHELVDLRVPSPEEIYRDSCYYLGFEPVRGVYKLLRFYAMGTYVQICTLGRGGGNDLVWRDLDTSFYMDHDYSVQHICLGILYLMGWKWNHSWKRLLVALDLSAETATEIIAPADFLPYFRVKNTQLVQVGGSPALISFECTMGYRMGIISILLDNGTWTKSRRLDFMGMMDSTYAGTLPTGELLLSRKTPNNKKLAIYKYDHILDKFLNWIEVEIPKYGYRFDEQWKICYHEYNILPLGSLLQ